MIYWVKWVISDAQFHVRLFDGNACYTRVLAIKIEQLEFPCIPSLLCSSLDVCRNAFPTPGTLKGTKTG